MESETEENLSLDAELPPSDTLSSDTLSAVTPTPTGKKKSKKKDQGSDVAFFACFPCMVIAAAAIVLSIIGFLPMGWFADFCASLRAQYVIILLLCALPPLFAPQVRAPMVVACGLFALINLLCVVPCMLPKGAISGEKKNLQYLKFRVMQFSIDDVAVKTEPIIDLISAQHPEIVCVTGVPMPVLLKLNEKMPSQYLHRKSFPREDGYAMAVYSTVPLKGTTLRKVGPEKLPVILTSMHFDYSWFRIILFKVPEATDNDTLEKRNEQLKATAQLVKGLNGRKIVVGNFNTSPYSMAFGDFLKDTELRDTRIGVQPNWNLGPVDFIGLLHIPVDHMLANKNVEVLERYVCPEVGLSHRPLLGSFYPADTEIFKYSEQVLDAGGDVAAPAQAPAGKPAAKPADDADNKPVRKRRKLK